MDFIPYKINEALENVFIQIPVELFDNELYINLNSDSILLYGLLLSRLSLSLKNKWADKNGNVYLVYSRKEAQKMLKLSDKPITKAFRKLKEAKLAIFEFIESWYNNMRIHSSIDYKTPNEKYNEYIKNVA